jgi:hypothetical protein
MRKLALSAAAIALLSASTVLGQPGKKISEQLTGFQEVPALSTPGGGTFRARIANDGSAIAWELSYTAFATAVQQAHLHFENATNNGPITVFLCTNLGNGPVGNPACPAGPTTISGVIEADDVSPNIPATALAIANGLGTGELGELIRAIRAGSIYVNVHTVERVGGEVRAQLGGHPGQGHGNPHN